MGLSEQHPQREGLVQRPRARVCLACSEHSKEDRGREVTGVHSW